MGEYNVQVTKLEFEADVNKRLGFFLNGEDPWGSALPVASRDVTKLLCQIP